MVALAMVVLHLWVVLGAEAPSLEELFHLVPGRFLFLAKVGQQPHFHQCWGFLEMGQQLPHSPGGLRLRAEQLALAVEAVVEVEP